MTSKEKLAYLKEICSLWREALDSAICLEVIFRMFFYLGWLFF